MGKLFGVDSIVTKLGIGLFFTTVHASCPIALKTRSNSACTLPDDNNDDIYASDSAGQGRPNRDFKSICSQMSQGHHSDSMDL